MDRWLKCRVSSGMFSNERVIIVRIKGNGSIEEFVPEDQVSGVGDNGRVKVQVFQREDTPWAVLPTTYRKTVPIEEEQLVRA